jgi:hypothetical protein
MTSQILVAACAATMSPVRRANAASATQAKSMRKVMVPSPAALRLDRDNCNRKAVQASFVRAFIFA